MRSAIHFGSHLSTIEFGGSFRNAHKYDDSYENDSNSERSVPMTQFPSTFWNYNYYDGAYRLGPNPNYQSVLGYCNANPDRLHLDCTLPAGTATISISSNKSPPAT